MSTLYVQCTVHTIVQTRHTLATKNLGGGGGGKHVVKNKIKAEAGVLDEPDSAKPAQRSS